MRAGEMSKNQYKPLGWVIKVKSSNPTDPLFMKYKGENEKEWQYILLPNLNGAILFKTLFETQRFINGFPKQKHDLEPIQINKVLPEAKSDN